MDVPDIPAFCAHLKTEREARNISLETISARTRINVRFLEALEAGDFTVLQDVYVRIFLRNYIRCVGLDEKALLREFDELRGTAVSAPGASPEPPEAPVAAAAAELPPEEAAPAEPAEPPAAGAEPFRKIAPLIIGALLIMALGYFLVGRMQRPAQPAPRQAPPAGLPLKPEAPVPVQPPAPAQPVAGLRLGITALSYIWVMVVADDSDTLQNGFMQADVPLSVNAADHVFIKIGLNERNGNALGLTLNGRDLGGWGAPHTRLTKFTVTKSGVDSASLVSRAIREEPAAPASPGVPANAAPADSSR